MTNSLQHWVSPNMTLLNKYVIESAFFEDCDQIEILDYFIR